MASKKALDKLERAKMAELRSAVRGLPLSELSKLRSEGLNGQPLFRALGFASQTELVAWLQQDGDGAKQVSKKKEETKPVKRVAISGDPWLRAEQESEVPSVKKLLLETQETLQGNNKDVAIREKSTKKKEKQASKTEREDTAEESDSDASSSEDENKPKSKSHKKKAPVERSSKHQVSRNRIVVQVPSYLKDGEDPRFSKQGVDMNLHRARYEFLDEARDEEIEEKRRIMQRELLARQLKGTRRGRRLKRLTDEELAELRSGLTRLEQHKAETKRSVLISEKLRELKRKNASKKGFFIAKKTRKEIERQVKMDDYSKRHKLERYEKRQEDKRMKKEKGDKGPNLGV